jgi:hypothetical protein
MMTNNDQPNSSPTSVLSVIGVWLYEMVQMSRTPFHYHLSPKIAEYIQSKSLNIHIHALYVTTCNKVGNLILTEHKG